MADPRTYIRVHDGMPDHPKVDGLSDAAFRLLVTTWCWSSRHLTDGAVPARTWKKRGTPKARRELLEAGLVEQRDDGSVVMHDYLEHQRSADEVADLKAARSKGGSWGSHKRWHLDRQKHEPGCEYCDRSTHGSTDNSGMTGPSQTDNSAMTSSSTETDRTSFGGSSRGSVDQSSSGSRRARATDDDSKIIRRIAETIHAVTGRLVDDEWAAKVRHQILDGRTVHDPAAYVVKAIRDDPQRYLPTSSDPSSRSVAEALRAAQGQP